MSEENNTPNPIALEVVMVPLGDLSEDPANARLHSDRNLDAVKASLRRFGQQKPIVVDTKGVIRAGNGTFSAAGQLGWEEIAVVYTDLEGAEATAYAIADNRAGELATWDQDVLARSLVALRDEQDGDSGLDGTGFSGADLNVLFGGIDIPEMAGEGGDFDAVPEFEGRPDLPSSGVRMVQLFLDEEGFDEYTELVARLAHQMGTDNQTETVIAVLRQVAGPAE